jgi:hypothetical protein
MLRPGEALISRTSAQKYVAQLKLSAFNMHELKIRSASLCAGSKTLHRGAAACYDRRQVRSLVLILMYSKLRSDRKNAS